MLSRIAQHCCAWSERWFPDAFAFAVMAVDFSGAYLWGWLSLFGPVSMYWLLVYVSGIPPLETLMLKSRGDAYRRYQARTHAFFPLPPRRQNSTSAKTAQP